MAPILCYRNKNYGLVPTDLDKYDKTLKFSGVALTNAGIELLDVIQLIDDNNYKVAFHEFLKEKCVELVEIGTR